MMTIILSFFMFIFVSYSSLLVGTHQWKKISMSQMMLMLCFFLVTFIMSMVYLGMSSMVFLWMFLFMFYSLDVFYVYYSESSKKGNLNLLKMMSSFFLEDFQMEILSYFEKPSKMFFVEYDRYKSNYKAIYCKHFLGSIFLSKLNEMVVNSSNVWDRLWDYYMVPAGISWYDCTLMSLKTMKEPNDENLKEELEFSKSFYNLSEGEMEQLKMDYSKHYIYMSKSY